eukprot:2571623-Rhodomonas_salina.1
MQGASTSPRSRPGRHSSLRRRRVCRHPRQHESGVHRCRSIFRWCSAMTLSNGAAGLVRPPSSQPQ